MPDNPYIRYVKGADTAILFVHGILGTPAHFAPLIPLVPPDWSVHNMLLLGHGRGVRDFSAASMARWKRQVHDALRLLLSSYSQVVIAAHSMGTLFAMQEAAENQVAALFLLNTPLKIHLTPMLLKTTWSVFLGNIQPNDERMLAAQRACSIKLEKNLLRYFGWAPRYLELFSEVKSVRPLAKQLAVPSQVYLSLQDEMVSPQSGKFFEGNTRVSVKMLQTSGHFYYSPADRQLLRQEFCQMIRQVSALKR